MKKEREVFSKILKQKACQFNIEEQWKALKAENLLIRFIGSNKYNADVEAAQKTIKSKKDLNKELLKLELEMLKLKK